MRTSASYPAEAGNLPASPAIEVLPPLHAGARALQKREVRTGSPLQAGIALAPEAHEPAHSEVPSYACPPTASNPVFDAGLPMVQRPAPPQRRSARSRLTRSTAAPYSRRIQRDALSEADRQASVAAVRTPRAGVRACAGDARGRGNALERRRRAVRRPRAPVIVSSAAAWPLSVSIRAATQV